MTKKALRSPSHSSRSARLQKARTQPQAHRAIQLRRFTRYRFLPFIVLMILNLGIVSFGPRSSHGVLAYATTMSVDELLSGTNGQRAANGSASLIINAKLAQAAQAKANDMVARDYWAHNTPDGNPPWIFFQNAGYSYSKAGENLAYGFSSAAGTITGWMNSPGHRANLLDTTFTEVGFGFANSANYVGSGPETIIVAEYGKPLGATTPITAPTTPATTQSAAPKAPTTTIPKATLPSSTVPTTPVAETPQNATPVPDATPTAPLATPSPANEEFVSAPAPQAKPTTQSISRIQTMTGGMASWSTPAAILAGISVIGLWIVGHGRRLARYIVQGERYIAHHISVDLTVVAFGLLIVLLTQTMGVIR